MDCEYIIFYQFHDHPQRVANRLVHILALNGHIPIIACYGGKLDVYEETKNEIIRQLKVLGITSIENVQFVYTLIKDIWYNQDLVTADWFARYGHCYNFRFLLYMDYDVLLLDSVAVLLSKQKDQDADLITCLWNINTQTSDWFWLKQPSYQRFIQWQEKEFHTSPGNLFIRGFSPIYFISKRALAAYSALYVKHALPASFTEIRFPNTLFLLHFKLAFITLTPTVRWRPPYRVEELNLALQKLQETYRGTPRVFHPFYDLWDRDKNIAVPLLSDQCDYRETVPSSDAQTAILAPKIEKNAKVMDFRFASFNEERRLVPFLQSHPVLDLSLLETNIQDHDLRELACSGGLKNLETLNIGYTQLSEAGLQHLACFQHMKELNLAHIRIGSLGLSFLQKQNSLLKLHLPNTNVGDDTISQITTLTNLQYLDLEYTNITDQGLLNIEKLVHLQHLDLTGTHITDKGLESLLRLEELRFLSLRMTCVTDTGLVFLHSLKKLQVVDLLGCQVSESGISNLRGALPGCSIPL